MNGFAPAKGLRGRRAALDALPEHRGAVGWGQGGVGELGQHLVEEVSPVHPPALARWGAGSGKGS